MITICKACHDNEHTEGRPYSTFRGDLPTVADHHESGPVEWMPVTFASQQSQFRLAQRVSFRYFRSSQSPVEVDH